jgi:CubicO group peptidase (beta-lactamase class C family)
MKSRFLIVLLITCICTTSVFARSDSYNQHQDVFTDISARVQKYIDEGLLDGVSIGVFNHEGLIWDKGFGYANREEKIKATGSTIYRVGSLTKLLTATAILQLEELKLIDIDQAVSAYIPGFDYKSRFSDSGVITTRHLLTHLSGLPSNINKGQWTEERFTNIVKRMQVEYVSYPTDFILNYSNVGYSMLGSIIEENTDYLYEEYIQHHLFEPLNMRHSSFAPYGATSRLSATGYKNHIAQKNLPIRDIPALGLNTSVKDLSHFLTALLNHGRYESKSILDPPTVKSMTSVQNSHVKLDYDDLIGIPWFIHRNSPDNAPLIVEHGGTTINYSSQVVMAPDDDLGVVILSNTSRVNRLIKNVASTLIKRLLSNTVQPVADPVQSISLVRDNTDSGKKKYVAKSGIIEIDSNAKMLCDCQTSRNINLVPLPDGWFGLSTDKKNNTKKIIEQNVNGKEVIVLEQNGEKHIIGSIYDENKNRYNWDHYFGKYEIVNADKDFPVIDVEIFVEDRVTYICYRMPKLSNKLIVIPIMPVSEKEAITEGVGRSKGETVFMQQMDGFQYLIYSGYIAKQSS